LRTAVAWLKSGHVSRVLCGGAESALTPFTLAQLAPLGIYSRTLDDPYPCRPLSALSLGDDSGVRQRSSLALGEGAYVCGMELSDVLDSDSLVILGTGVARERSPSVTGITATGTGFEHASKKALAVAYQQYGVNKSDVGIVVPHAAGTVKGDKAELAALSEVFGARIPPLFSTKWLTGHTFGASGLLGLDLAAHLLEGGIIPKLPYSSLLSDALPMLTLPRIALVQAAGFGGVAAAVIVGKGRF